MRNSRTTSLSFSTVRSHMASRRSLSLCGITLPLRSGYDDDASGLVADFCRAVGIGDMFERETARERRHHVATCRQCHRVLELRAADAADAKQLCALEEYARGIDADLL